jgi:hypothetical protein
MTLSSFERLRWSVCFAGTLGNSTQALRPAALELASNLMICDVLRCASRHAQVMAVNGVVFEHQS